MKKIVFQTDQSWAAFILRIGLGIVLFPHGAQKLTGWFGGYGFSGTMEYLTGQVGLPWLIGVLVILIEFAGAILLLLGLTTRVAALLIILQFIGIIFTAHASHGFFMNWEGTQAGEGFEYHLLIISLSLALLVQGGGKYSVDRQITAGTQLRSSSHKVSSSKASHQYS